MRVALSIMLLMLVEWIVGDNLRILDLELLIMIYAYVGTSGILRYTKEVLPNFIKMFLELLFKFLV